MSQKTCRFCKTVVVDGGYHSCAGFKEHLKKVGCGPWWVEDMPTEGRNFDTGAYRDTAEGKPSFYKALSPKVLRRYVEYLGENRKQSDGNMRDWDNWKAGIPPNVYADSGLRHAWMTWELMEAGTLSGKELEDDICGVLFNYMGLLHEILKGEEDAGN